MKNSIFLVITIVALSLLFTACSDLSSPSLEKPADAANEAAENSMDNSSENQTAGEDVFNPEDNSGAVAVQGGQSVQDDSSGPGNANEVGIVVITPSPTGNSAVLNVGELLVIEIPTIPAGEWNWVVEDLDSNMLMPQGDIQYTAGTEANSTGGVTRLTFLALSAGSTTLTVQYMNAASQEPSQSLPAGMTSASYSFSITVNGGNKLVVVRPAIKGVSAALKVGDTLVVEIPTIPAPGWTWVPDQLDTKVLAQVGQAEYSAGTAANDAGGIFRITFRAVGKGNISLTLLYVNSPSQDVGQAAPSLSSQSFGMSVTVE